MLRFTMIHLESLEHVGIPALTVNQFARVVSMNRYAAEFFRLSTEEAVGREWHCVVRSDTTSECCALCRTRHALRRGDPAQPLDTVLSISDGYRRQAVVIVPIPASADTSGDITFFIIDQSLA